MQNKVSRKCFIKTATTAGVAIAVAPFNILKPSPFYTPSHQRDRYLLLDKRIIDSTSNAGLELGSVRKDPHNPLFGEEKSWEVRFDNLCPNVFYDYQDKLYKCWYSPFIVDHSSLNLTPEERKKPYIVPDNREMGVCYATSKDGIKWDKPDLGIIEFQGSKQNNLVLRVVHGSGVFKDLRETDPAKRYKLFAKAGNSNKEKLGVAFSLDGLHWSPMIKCPEINPFNTDGNHFNALWAPELGKYVGFTRLRGVGKSKELKLKEFDGKSRKVRQIGRTVSSDFLKWTTAEMVFQGIEDHLQIYTMPVFRYGGVYLGLPVIFNTKTDRSHTELAWSPDTINWYRISPGTPLIPNSTEHGDYDWGCVYAAAYPVFREDEIRLYYGGSDGLHTSWRNGFLCLATMRPDGFAGYVQKSNDRVAQLTTKAVPYSNQKITITADIGQGGYVKVSILDSDNRLLAESKTISETITDKELELNGDVNMDHVKLKFEFSNATIYSFGYIDF